MTGITAETRIRPAQAADAARIAEIEIFNYRLHFYPFFQNDPFYFEELQVPALMERYIKDASLLANSYVYDDGVIKGFVRLNSSEIQKLFVEPVLQNKGIGAALLQFAVVQKNARFLWALEKNERAIAFYQRNGFHLTNERKLEEDTTEYLVRMER